MGESTKSVRIFTIVVLSLFMLTIIYFTASIIGGFKNGASRAEQDFMRISETASSAFFFNNTAASSNALQNVLVNNEYVAAALISSEKNVLFAYPDSSPLIGMNIHGIPAVQSSSPMIRIFSTRLASAPDDNTMLTVALYAVRSADIYNPARISFLVILAGLAAIFVMILYVSRTPVSSKVSEHVFERQSFALQEKDSVIFPSMPFSDTINDVKENPAAKNPIEEKESPAVNQETGFTAETAFSQAEKTLKTDNSPETVRTQIPADEHSEAEELNSYDAANDIENSKGTDECTASFTGDPSGLFSPATGVGWEQYLETRLDSELMRSASSEQDLALVLLRIPGIENNRLMMKKIAAVLLDFFKFKDFVFEYKNDGFAGILLNINLDQTMVLAETVYTQFKELLQSENIPPKLALGISMRSLRLLPGSRLIDEADKALQKAFDEAGMPIVAFRVNPDKYRQFVADSARENR